MLENETLITLDDAAKRLCVSYAHVWKLARRGVGGRKLETVLIGSSGMRTSVEACQRYTRYLTERRTERDEPSSRGASRAPAVVAEKPARSKRRRAGGDA